LNIPRVNGGAETMYKPGLARKKGGEANPLSLKVKGRFIRGNGKEGGKATTGFEKKKEGKASYSQ